MREKPKIGQILYSLNVGNAARYGREQKLTPVTVTKVGRKYFYCKVGNYLETQYHLKTWKDTGQNIGSVLYLNAEEWEIEKETIKICKFLSSSFNYGRNVKGINYKTLQDIEKLILIGENDGE